MIERGEDGTRVPLAATVLGAAGLLPLILALFVRLAGGVYPDTPIPLMIGGLALSYAALILSFLGGIWWGVAATRATPEQLPRLMGIAVVPTLVALLVVGLAWNFPAIASITLAVAIALTPLVDRDLARRGLVPVWWMRLRLPLSLALAALTLGLGLSLA
ncbi:DUF3429 domain-containing protein [uncultured Sphingomonas sp.]|uniref:DUF3429 domain-containing protein n=1 Tax=uncultured Sphingomonas sp. TaxID=158754 RepID=UPI00260BB874|nr:DUF3429 domain-containing protein [uncultured Sphingomonas sp.]